MSTTPYRPDLGRFLSEDPIDAPGSNAYTYVGGRPTRFTDPLGLWYVDLNVSASYGIFTGTGGVAVNRCGFFPYLGGGVGVGSPISGSITVSGQDPTPGWNTGFQLQGGPAY